jgi:hypothetical protein
MKPLLLPLALCLSVVSTASATLELTGELVNFKETKEGGEKAAAPEAMRSGYGPRPITQNKVLNVTVRNASGKPEPGVTVRYWIIGRDPNSSKSALLDGGEAQLNLKPNGVEVIASEPVKTTYTPPAIFKQRSAPRPAAPPPPPKPAEGEEVKNVAPKGLRISGFAIQAVRDGRVIAENVQDEGVKKLIGSEGKKPGPLFSVDRPPKADE